MKKNNQITNNDIKFILKPLAIFAVVLAFFVLILIFGTRQLKSGQQKLDKVKKLQTVLTQNVNTLRQVDSEIGTQQNFIEVALPTNNSSVYFISQIKTQAIDTGVFISNIKTSSDIDVGKGLSKSSVSFDVEGSADAVSGFIDGITKMLPIGNIDKVKTVVSGDTARSSVAVNVFSSELPNKIPSITSAITSLSEEETELLTDLTSYALPSFIRPVPKEEGLREDPFQ